MYLSELNVGEKKNFLELAKFSMGVNGEHKAEEQDIYHSFLQECGLVDYQLLKQDKIESVIKVLARSSAKAKRIILLELFGILLADGEICSEEADFIQQLTSSLEIDEFEAKRIQRWVIAMNDMVSEGFSLINKE
jgi:hypothetical protein